MKDKKVRSVVGKVVYYSIGVPVTSIYLPLMAIDIAMLAVGNLVAGVPIKDTYYTHKGILKKTLEDLENALEWEDNEKEDDE